MALRHIAISILIVILGLIGIFKLYEHYHRPLTHHLNADLQWIGLIDLDKTHDVSLKGVMDGENLVLVVDHANVLYQSILQKIPQAKYLSPEELFNINNLHLFDLNGDGQITAKDPIFDHFYVIKFSDNGEQNDIKSLSAAGIKAIIINNTTPTGNHVAILDDGTSRQIVDTNKLERSN